MIYIAVGLVLGLALSALFRPRKAAVTVELPKVDTLVVRDTIVAEKPVYRVSRVTDTMLVAVTDTVTLRDTVWLSLPRETRIYEDDSYRAVVSGYRPELESIAIFPETKTIYSTEQMKDKRRWGLGLQVGYGFHVSDGKIGHSPYIGIGVSYDLLRW